MHILGLPYKRYSYVQKKGKTGEYAHVNYFTIKFQIDVLKQISVDILGTSKLYYLLVRWTSRNLSLFLSL